MLSAVDEHILKALKQGLEQAFGHSVELKYRTDSLSYAYDPERRQYLSPRLLSRLRRIKKGTADKILGIVDVDIYSPGFDFVFGEADINYGVGTVSFYRLRQERYGLPPDARLLEERAIKEAVHELGHLYGLGHCRNQECVMHFSISLSNVDIKGKTFCSRCQQRLRKCKPCISSN